MNSNQHSEPGEDRRTAGQDTFEANARDRHRITEAVFEKELEDIKQRREKMFGSPQSADDPRQDLVGLALSGGGVRSAAFNFGVLQAFVETGLIRWVDYISTVSGGGYIGGCLSTTLHEASRARTAEEENQTPDHEEPQNGDRQCPQETRTFWQSLEFPPRQGEAVGDARPGKSRLLKTPFYRGGQYVRDGMQFVETLVWGALCNMLVWAGLLLFGTALVALIWRASDYPPLTIAIRHYAPWGHEIWWSDYSRPFLIPFAMFFVWLVWRGWLLIRGSNDARVATPSHSRYLFVAAAVGTAIGAAVLLSNSEISNRHKVEADSPIVETTNVVSWVLVGVVAALLLPYFNPLRLARSEIRPVGRFESMLMGYAGLGLLLVVPFTAVYFFASEDLSGSAVATGRELHQVDFRWPPELLTQFKKEAETPSPIPTVGAVAYQHINQAWNDPANGPRFSDRLDEAAAYYECVPEITAIRLAAAADENTAAGALLLFAALKQYVELRDKEDRADWWGPQSIEGRRLFCERAFRDTFGTHLAQVMEQHVLTDANLLTVLRSRFSRVGATDEEQAFFHGMASLEEGEQFTSVLWPKVLASDGHLSDTDVKQANRLIFEASYPDLVRPRSQASFHMIWYRDEVIRAVVAGASLIVFLLAGYWISFNATSMQGFYREKLRDAYFVGDSKLSELQPTAVGGPYQIFCAALNFFDDLPWRVAEYSQTYTFMFSRHYCGSESLSAESQGTADSEKPVETAAAGRTSREHGYAATKDFCGDALDVPSVAAISGAAFSPAIFRNPFMTFGTFLLNLRLGQWLPNPKRITTKPPADGRSAPESKCSATALPIMWDFIRTLTRGRRRPEDWRYCFVSDGGHNDNLGLAPLVLRRCKLIIVSDASQDEEYEFGPLLKFYRRIRMRFGMDMVRCNSTGDDRNRTFDLTPLRPRQVTASRTQQRRLASRLLDAVAGWRRTHERTDCDAEQRSKEHFILADLLYPDGSKALFVYLKPTFTGDEPIDLVQYRRENPAFPHDPTTDQMYTEDRVESYRRLGHHVAMRLCDRLQRGISSSSENLKLWDSNYSVDELVKKLTKGIRRSRLSYDNPTIAKLIGRLDTAPELRNAAHEQLARLGPPVLPVLCRVNTDRRQHSDNQRIRALQLIVQILAAQGRTLREQERREVQAMARDAIDRDANGRVRALAEEVFELATATAAGHDPGRPNHEAQNVAGPTNGSPGSNAVP